MTVNGSNDLVHWPDYIEYTARRTIQYAICNMQVLWVAWLLTLVWTLTRPRTLGTASSVLTSCVTVLDTVPDISHHSIWHCTQHPHPKGYCVLSSPIRLNKWASPFPISLVFVFFSLEEPPQFTYQVFFIKKLSTNTVPLYVWPDIVNCRTLLRRGKSNPSQSLISSVQVTRSR